MKRFLLALTLGCAMAQNVHVVEMSKSDADKAAELHQRLVEAQRNWLRFKGEMQDKYGAVPDSDQKTSFVYHLTAEGKTIRYRNDWILGIEFSDDFRYIAPSACSAKQK